LVAPGLITGDEENGSEISRRMLERADAHPSLADEATQDDFLKIVAGVLIGGSGALAALKSRRSDDKLRSTVRDNNMDVLQEYLEQKDSGVYEDQARVRAAWKKQAAQVAKEQNDARRQSEADAFIRLYSSYPKTKTE
jgi:hypothetical protein